MDREGNPSFNPILNPNDLKDQFNATDPVDDVTNYLQPLSASTATPRLPTRGRPPPPTPCCPTSCTYDRTMPPTTPTAGS